MGRGWSPELVGGIITYLTCKALNDSVFPHRVYVFVLYMYVILGYIPCDVPDGRARAKHLKFKTLNIYNKSVVLNHQHTAMEVTAADRLINESENKSSFQYPKLNSNLCALAPLVNGSRSEQNPLRAIRVFVPP